MHRPLLAESLEAACRLHADRIALEGDGIRLRYGELWAGACTLARALADAGIGTGDVAMARCGNHPRDFVAFLGAWLTGAAVAPVHRTVPPDVLLQMHAKAQWRVVIDPLGGPTGGGLCNAFTPNPQAPLQRRPTLDDGALVIFTSGSTGLPKGVVLSHRAFHAKLLQNQRLFGLSSDTTTLLVLNDTFSFGIWVALLTLMQGGRVVACPRFAPQTFLDTLAAQRVSFVGVVPTMIRATFGTLDGEALQAARRRIGEAGALQQMVIGGEPLGRQLSAELRRFIAPARLYDVYGLTETSTSDFVLDPADQAGHEGSIGRPCDGIAFRIVDGDGRACAPGQAGELQLQTPTLMNGYLGDEALTTNAFADGWFRTGDLATRDDDGFVWIVGRLKEVIVRGGNKITPLEVERALLRCDGVADALVAGMPDPILGQRIHALLVPKPGARLDVATVRRELAPLLEKYKTPDAWHVGDALPTGRTGKIDRGRLQRGLAAGEWRALEG